MLQMLVRDFMTSSVVSLTMDDDLRKASVTLAVNGISGAPVIDREEHLLGIVSGMDILRYVRDMREKWGVECPALTILVTPFDEDIEDEDLRKFHRKVSETSVGEIMTQEVLTVHPDDRLIKAMELMLDNDVKRLPVVEKNRVVGIISRKDIIWAIYRGRT